MKSYIKSAIERIQASGIATAATMQGCTEEEIRALEQVTGLTLPASYREFLRFVGKRAGTLLEGSDLGYEWLIGNQAQARDLVQETGCEWPDDGFAFVLHQGYSGLLFRAGDGDDPPVYRFDEEGPVTRVFDSFTGWLDKAIEDEARLL